MATSLLPPSGTGRSPHSTRRPLHRVALGLGVVAALLLGLVGCGVAKGFISTIRALDEAGFSASSVQPESGDTVAVEVKKDADDLDVAAADAAKVVWENLPLPIERLEVTCTNGFGGEGTYAADRVELERRFGTRDPDLDRGLQGNDLRNAGLLIAGLFLVGLLALGGIVTLIIVLASRARKRKPPPGPPPPGAPGGWGTQPPPPGYGRQP